MTYAEDDKLDGLIRLAFYDTVDEDMELFEAAEASASPLSRRLGRRIKRLIAVSERRERAEKQEKGETRVTVKRLRTRIVIAIILAVSILFATAMSAWALRSIVWEKVISWYENYITVSFKPHEPPPPSSPPTAPPSTEGEAPPTPQPPTYIEEVRMPTYYPEGMIKEETFLQGMTYALYYLEDESQFINFTQKLLGDNTAYYDNNTAVLEEITRNGIDFLLITYKKTPDVILLWTDGEYRYSLEAVVADTEELFKVALSVAPKTE